MFESNKICSKWFLNPSSKLLIRGFFILKGGFQIVAIKFIQSVIVKVKKEVFQNVKIRNTFTMMDETSPSLML